MPKEHEKTCPRCGSVAMKTWSELSADEKFTVRRLPLSAEYLPRERRRHRFCTRCWFEDTSEREARV